MILKRLKLDTMLAEPTNCYIIVDEETKETIVIDPASQAEKIIEMLKILSAKLKYIYLTHCHGDHIGAVVELKKACGGKILIHRIESENLNNLEVNLAEYIGMQEIELEADSRVDDKDLIHIGDLQLKVIHTPGHTKGSTSLYCEKEKMIFTGDTMFRGTWGRTDLPTGSLQDIIESITNKLIKEIPDETIVYPGHGKSTRIGEEKPIYLELKQREF
ncbi:MAG: MBL fold metallo-hydrolase [Clostridia bacterium]|jgi:hydroxyacylglutathione hydrolase|nr:MBL fold metallo-hydrolase [Clostridia bacterium]